MPGTGADMAATTGSDMAGAPPADMLSPPNDLTPTSD
jgi:hypothetical protein